MQRTITQPWPALRNAVYNSFIIKYVNNQSYYYFCNKKNILYK